MCSFTLNLTKVFHHSMKPQDNDFNTNIYILYYHQIFVNILHSVWLVFLIFRIIYCPAEVLEQPRGVMIRQGDM